MSKWCCIFCKKDISWAGKSKHLFSRSHEIELAKAILVSKSLWVTWLQKYEGGQKSAFPPLIKINNKYYSLCYPCKSLVSCLPDKLLLPCSCGQMDLQVKKIKAILALDLKVIEEAKKENNSALEKEVILLRNQKALLEKKNKQMISDVDCFTEYISWCKEHLPGHLESVIGSNPENWRKALLEIAGLAVEEAEEEEEAD